MAFALYSSFCKCAKRGRKIRRKTNEETKPIFEVAYLGNAWSNFALIWNVECWRWRECPQKTSFCFIKAALSYGGAKIAFSFFLSIYSRVLRAAGLLGPHDTYSHFKISNFYSSSYYYSYYYYFVSLVYSRRLPFFCNKNYTALLTESFRITIRKHLRTPAHWDIKQLYPVYSDDIIVITLVLGSASDSCNINDITLVPGYTVTRTMKLEEVSSSP